LQTIYVAELEVTSHMSFPYLTSKFVVGRFVPIIVTARFVLENEVIVA